MVVWSGAGNGFFFILLVSWIYSDISLRKIQILLYRSLRKPLLISVEPSYKPLEEKVYQICCE